MEYERKVKKNDEVSKTDQLARMIDTDHEGREAYEMDVDRMVNEGLGGGYITDQNGRIGDTTTDFM